MGRAARAPPFFIGRFDTGPQKKEAVALTPKEMLKKAVEVLSERKAEDLTAIGIGKISILADYFLIVTGNSTTQVKSLAEELEFRFSEAGIEPLSIEGAHSATWIVMDYGSLVIHLFRRDVREFYNLERLWADGEPVDISSLIRKEG